MIVLVTVSEKVDVKVVSEVAAGAIAVSVTANPPCTRSAKRTNGEVHARN